MPVQCRFLPEARDHEPTLTGIVNQMTKFLLIRHATTDSVGIRLSGRRAGVNLNEAGIQQAEKLAGEFSGTRISAVYSSPLERAVQTAEAISKVLGLQTRVSEDFLEINFGVWTNRTFKELESESLFKQFNVFRSFTRIPEGETMMEAQLRMIRGMEKLCLLHPDETVVIVSHSDLIKATIAYYSGIPLDMFQRIEISPASVSIIKAGSDYAVVELVNYTADLRI
jgi:broad specificity phosphatase PhoE